MIAIPERITKNGNKEVEKDIATLTEYIDYLTERLNKVIAELDDRLRDVENGG